MAVVAIESLIDVSGDHAADEEFDSLEQDLRAIVVRRSGKLPAVHQF